MNKRQEKKLMRKIYCKTYKMFRKCAYAKACETICDYLEI